MFLVACADEPLAAGALADRSSLALASVSEHLKVLRKTGLLRLERRGRFWLYQSNRAALAAVISALEMLPGGRDGA